MPKKMTIKRSDAITFVIEAYENARPNGMNASYLMSASNTEEEGVLDGILEAGSDEALKAAKKVGGFVGIAGAAAVGGLKQFFSNIADWLQSDQPELHVSHELDYLGPNRFAKNNNIEAEELSMLQACYDVALRYQQLKMSRGWFLGLGKNYKEEEISDPKYLANIFIGRKIELAAKASSKEEYETQINHLTDFLQELTKNDELLKSSSNDSSYLSLRTLIVFLQQKLQPKMKNEMALSDTEKLKRLAELLEQNANNLKSLIESSQDHFMNLLTSYNREDINFYTEYSKNEVLQNDNRFKKLKDDNYFQYLFAIYINDNNSIDIPKVLAMLKKASGVGISSDSAEEIKETIKSILLIQYKMNLLLKKFNEIKGQKSLDGINSLRQKINEMKDLYNKLKVNILDLRKEHAALINKLPSIYMRANTAFRDRYVKNADVRLSFNNVENIDESLFILEQLNVDKVDEQTENLQSVDEMENLERSVQLVKDEESSLMKEFLKDAVIVFDSERDEIESLKKEIDERDKNIEDLRADYSNLALKLSESQKKEKTLKQSNKTLLSDKSQGITNIETVLGNFQTLIRQYKKNTSRGFIDFFDFSIHGRLGRERADSILRKFQKVMDQTLTNYAKSSSHHSFDELIESFRKEYKSFIENNKELLGGNHRAHSLKTYLAAYDDYLSKVKNPRDEPVFDEYIKNKNPQYFADDYKSRFTSDNLANSLRA